MKLKLTLSLIAINLFLLGALYFTKESKIAPQRDARSLGVSVAAKDIHKMEFSGKSLDATRTLVRNGDHWFLQEPIQWAANKFAVESILDQIQSIGRDTSFSLRDMENAGQSLGDYGLDRPGLIITLARKDSEVKILIGEPTEIGSKFYVLDSTTNNISVVPADFLEVLTGTISNIADPSVFNMSSFEVKSLFLHVGGAESKKVRLVKNGKNWSYEVPLTVRADAEKVFAMIKKLNDMEVTVFLSDQKQKVSAEDVGLQSPDIKFTLSGSQKRQTLLVGKPSPAKGPGSFYYAQLENNPTYFLLEASYVDLLKDLQYSLRDRHFLTFKPNELKEITVEQGESGVVLRKLETGAWQVFARDSGGEEKLVEKADATLLADLVQGLLALKAVNFANDAPSTSDLDKYGLKTPQRTLTLLTESGQKAQFLVGNISPSGHGFYAKVSGAPYVYEVEAPLLERIPVSALYYKNRVLASLPSGSAVSQIKLTDLSKEKTLFNESIDPHSETWLMHLEQADANVREATLDVVEALRRLEVKKYLPNEYSESAFVSSDGVSIPWKYRLDVTVVLLGGSSEKEETWTFYFTKRLSGGVQIALFEKESTLFALHQTFIDSLHELTFEGVSLDVDTSATASEPLGLEVEPQA